LPRFNRRVTNRVTRTHRIPVSVLPQPGGYRFALTDGVDSDRVKNVPAAGGCHIRPGRHDVTLVEPGGGQIPRLSWASFPARLILPRVRAVEYLDRTARTPLTRRVNLPVVAVGPRTRVSR